MSDPFRSRILTKVFLLFRKARKSAVIIIGKWELLLTHQWAELLWASSWRRPSSPRALMEALLWILANQWRYIRLPPEWRWTTNTSAAVVNGRLKQREERRNENNKSLGSITSLIRYARNLHYWENTFTIWGCTTGFIFKILFARKRTLDLVQECTKNPVQFLCTESPERP